MRKWIQAWSARMSAVCVTRQLLVGAVHQGLTSSTSRPRALWHSSHAKNFNVHGLSPRLGTRHPVHMGSGHDGGLWCEQQGRHSVHVIGVLPAPDACMTQGK